MTVVSLVMVTMAAPWAPASAQTDGTVTGLVTTVTGIAIEAAQVSIVGTGIGALTNTTGRYLLLGVPPGDHLLDIQVVGFRTRRIAVHVPAGGSGIGNVALSEVAFQLDEIVVTGTGAATTKRQLGNTVGIVDATRLSNAPISNFSELIQAREPSVVAFTSDGAVGSGSRIRIRGSNSISMSNEPLVYVDGVRVDNSGDMGGNGRHGDWGSPLDDINWEGVERVEILKGPAAATLYGSEASSGVIQIFTRRGSTGPATIRTTGEFGTSVFPNVIEPAAGFARDASSAAALGTLYGMDIQPFEVFERDFMSDIFETGVHQSYSADVSGGSDEFQYYVAGRFADEDGPLGLKDLGAANDALRRIQASASLAFVPRPGLRLRMMTSYVDTRFDTFVRNNDPGSPVVATWWSKPEDATCAASAPDATSTFGAQTPRCTGAGNPTGAPGFGTPRELSQNDRSQHTRHFTSSFQGAWTGRGLDANITIGIDQVDERADQSRPYGWRVDGLAPSSLADGGVRSLASRTHRELTFDGRVSWSGQLGPSFTTTLTTGGQAYVTDEWGGRVAGRGFPAPGIADVGLAAVSTATDYQTSKVGLGSYGQAQLGYLGWIFGTVGLRLDRASPFGAEAGSALYPKAAVSAVLSDREDWGSTWVPTLRIRAAVGQSGLQPGAFDKLTTYRPRQTPGGAGFEPGTIGNPNLRPERATEMEAGIEAEIAGGRVGIDVTVWDRTTRDALIQRNFAAAGGFTEPQLENLGRLDSSGLEIAIRGLLLESSTATISVFGNAAYMRQRVAELGGTVGGTASGAYPRHRNSIVEGLAPGTFLGAQMIPQCTTGMTRTCYEPGSTVPYDIDRDSIPDSLSDFRAYLTGADAISLSELRLLLDDEDGDGDPLDHVLGKPTPDWQGSAGVDVTLWDRLTVNSLFEYRAGGYQVANLTGAFRRAFRQNTRASAEVESILLDPATRSDPDARTAAAMRWTELVSLSPYSGLNLLEDADMVRWREVSVSYRVPPAWSSAIRAQDLTVTLSGRNLAVWTHYSGTDPEANEIARCGGAGEAGNGLQCNFVDATEMFTLPLPRRFGLSVRMVF